MVEVQTWKTGDKGSTLVAGCVSLSGNIIASACSSLFLYVQK